MKQCIINCIFVILATITSTAFADISKPSSFWLPEFANKKELIPWVQSVSVNPHWFITSWISEGIKYVWFLAIISLIVAWITYMTSYWVDAKTKKAKNMIMYSIIWILVAITAYTLVDIINSISLG